MRNASEATHHSPLVPIERFVADRMVPTSFVIVYEFAPRESHRVASSKVADCPISRVKCHADEGLGGARSLAGTISAALTSTAKELAQVSQLSYLDHSHPLVRMDIHVRCHHVSFGSAFPLRSREIWMPRILQTLTLIVQARLTQLHPRRWVLPIERLQVLSMLVPVARISSSSIDKGDFDGGTSLT